MFCFTGPAGVAAVLPVDGPYPAGFTWGRGARLLPAPGARQRIAAGGPGPGHCGAKSFKPGLLSSEEPSGAFFLPLCLPALSHSLRSFPRGDPASTRREAAL